MITNYIPNMCGYGLNNLKKVVHIFSESANVIHIDNGEAYVTSGITDLQTISATSVSFEETTAYDDRFKFQKTVTATVNGFAKLSALGGKYYIVLEDVNGIMWLVNADFPSLVTYTYTLQDGTDETVFTFSALSNFPTLKLNASINNAYACQNYSLVRVDEIKMLEKRYANINASTGIVYGYSNQVYKTVRPYRNSIKVEETFDGTNANTTIQFSIGLDDYQSSWHYNMLEYPYNKYVAVIDHLACGFEMGLVPSYNVQGSHQIGGGDTVTVTLVGGSQRGSEWAENWTEVTIAPVFRWELSDEWVCEPTYEEKFIFTLNDSSTVTARCDDTGAVIFPEVSAYTSSIISATLGGCTTNIGNWSFSGCSSMTSFTMTDNVTTLGYLAFENCSSLASIQIPTGITEIQFGTFSNCSSLSKIEIPSGVTSIGYGAFQNCSGLTGITCLNETPGTLGEGAFDNTNDCPIYVPCASVDTYKAASGWSVYADRIQCKPKYILRLNNSNIVRAACDSTSAVTSGEVTSQYRDSVVSAEIGECVTSISARAFQNCTGLTSVSISNNVISIGDFAFYTCRSLTSIDIPSGVTSIGNGAFTSCSNLTSVEIPSGVTRISLTTFEGCTSLTSVTIPDSVTSIGHSAFTYCYGLTSVGLVGSGASVEIPSGVTSLNFEIFYNCTGLTSVTIPSGVSSIGGQTFYGCRSLTSITCYSTNPPYLSSIGLVDTNDCPIYVPAASVNAYKSASGWSNYDYRIQAIPDS